MDSSTLSYLFIAFVLYSMWVTHKLVQLTTWEPNEEEKEAISVYPDGGAQSPTCDSFIVSTKVDRNAIRALLAWERLGWDFYPEELRSTLVTDLAFDRKIQLVSTGNVVHFAEPVHFVVHIGGCIDLDIVFIVAGAEVPEVVSVFNSALEMVLLQAKDERKYTMTMNVVDGCDRFAYDRADEATLVQTEREWSKMPEGVVNSRDVAAYLECLSDAA